MTHGTAGAAADTAVGLERGEGPATSSEMPVRWVEFPEMDASDRRGISPGDRCPAVDLTFFEAQDYCEWLADRTDLPIRLPSEAGDAQG